jgi:PD-(D/E)XK nuclease superfamily/Domain of unknown function (DUF2357)
VRRNDEILELSVRSFGGSLRVVAGWPPSDAGSYTLSLSWLDGSEPDEVRTCRVMPSKLDSQEVDALVHEIQEQLPASLAFALSRRGALAGITLVPPGDATPAQELDHLRRAIEGAEGRPGLASLLPRIALQPYQVLGSEVRWTQAERAHQVRSPDLSRAFGRPGNVDADRRPTTVPERRATHTTDVYENQVVRLYCDLIAQRLNALVNLPQRAGVRDQSHHLLRRFAAVRRVAAFLDDVQPLAGPPRPSMALLQRADYRAVSDGLRDLRRRALIRVEDEGVAARLNNVPRLYEKWLTFQAIVVTLEVANQLGYRQDRVALVRRYGDAFLVAALPGGNTPLVALSHQAPNVKVRLFAQRNYLPKDRATHQDRLFSISYKQIPDVAIEVERPSGVDILIFDAKYKLESEGQTSSATDTRPKKADVDAMHAYSDAIRDEGDRRVVRYAAILYPGRSAAYGNHIAALRARPADAESLREDLRRVIAPVLTSA